MPHITALFVTLLIQTVHKIAGTNSQSCFRYFECNKDFI